MLLVMTLYWLTPLMPLHHQARSRTGSGLLAYFGNHFYSPFLQTGTLPGNLVPKWHQDGVGVTVTKQS